MWFLIAVLFFILWLDARKKNKTLDGIAYDRGYQAGLKAPKRPRKNESDDEEAELVQSEVENDNLRIGSFATLPVEQDDALVVTKDKPELTPAERDKRSVRNMNALLYFASFLLVAAAAAFIATSAPASVRLGGLIVVVVLFYTLGITLHIKVKQLRPAAVAFTGTALAIIPFIGVALHMLVNVPEMLAWLIISGIGLVAYYVAALVLQSQVVSYLTLAFLISLVSASVGVASLPIVWYFIAIMGVSIVASSVSVLAPKALPALFSRPVEQTGQVVTPVVLAASLLCSSSLTLIDFEIIFAVATAHYLLSWLQVKVYRNETIARVLLNVTALLITADIADLDQPTIGLVAAGTFALQAIYSLVRVYRDSSKSVRKGEIAWMIVMLICLQSMFGMWSTLNLAALLTSAALLAGTVLAMAAIAVFKNANWIYAALPTSVFLVFSVARDVFDPHLSWTTVAVIFGIMAAVSVGWLRYASRYWHGGRIESAMLVSSALYLILMVGTGFASDDSVVSGLVLLALVTGMIAISYCIRAVSVEIAAILPLIVSVAFLLSETSFHSNQWYQMGIIIITAIAVAVATLAHYLRRERDRRDGLFASGLVVLMGLLPAAVLASQAVQKSSLIIFVLLSIVMIGVRISFRNKSLRLQLITSVAYVGYIVAAWAVVMFSLGALWAALVYVVAMVIFWISSFIEKQPILMLIGNVSLVAALHSLWTGLELASEWRLYGVGLIGAAVLYGSYWLLVERSDTKRSDLQIGSLWALFAGTLVLGAIATDTAHIVMWSVTLLIFALTIGVYGITRKLPIISETSVYMATFGLQRLVSIAVPELNIVFYAHWWALTIVAVLWWTRIIQYRTVRYVVAAALVTLTVAIMALSNGGWYQTFFLAEQVVLLTAGALWSRRWLMWWGLIWSSLAVLYFLREYTYLWLAFLGLFLIAIVVWQLLRRNTSQKK